MFSRCGRGYGRRASASPIFGMTIPDGTILVKLAWKRERFEEFAPDDPTTIQVMVKDSKKYAATGGWGVRPAH